jgi:hypothetical protein
MIWGVIYLATMISILIFVEISKVPETRGAMRALCIASLLTLAAVLSGVHFYTASILLTMLDFAVLGVFIVQALSSRRYWTLCLPAFQLITCMIHLARFAAPDVLPRVYEAGQGFWAYPQMALVLAAAIWGRSYRRSLTRG